MSIQYFQLEILTYPCIHKLNHTKKNGIDAATGSLPVMNINENPGNITADGCMCKPAMHAWKFCPKGGQPCYIYTGSTVYTYHGDIIIIYVCIQYNILASSN